jgi:23S rRNA (uracil1939-C5)-methyltransferase
VPFALPGEEVAIAHVEKRGKVLRGALRRVISASPDRVAAPCPYVEACGGCPLMMLADRAQRAVKRAWVERAAGVPPSLVAAEVTLGTRERARLAFETKGGAVRIGFRSARSRGVVDVDVCAVLSPVTSRGLAFARARLAPRLVGSGEIWLAHGAGGLPVLWLQSESAEPPHVYEAAREGVSAGELAGAALRVGGAGEATFGDPRERSVALDGEPLVGPTFGFSQAHGGLNRELVRLVLALAAPAGKSVLELYAGTGNLTVALAREARALTAVESSADAARACEANLEARGLRAKVKVVADDAAMAAGRERAAEVVILDPPRTGARDAIAPILALAPERIVYVSCDPPTLGRDVAMLGGGGYRVASAHALDMFPHTAHVEAVVVLEPC